jgi:hypothetical protein
LIDSSYKNLLFTGKPVGLQARPAFLVVEARSLSGLSRRVRGRGVRVAKERMCVRRKGTQIQQKNNSIYLTKMLKLTLYQG